MFRAHFSARVLQAKYLWLLVSLRGVLHCAAKRLTEPLQVPFDLVFRVKFTAEFFLGWKKKKQKTSPLCIAAWHPFTCTHTCTESQDPAEVAVSSVCHHGCPPAVALCLLSPRVASEPWTDLGACSDAGIISHSTPERHFRYATSPNGSTFKTWCCPHPFLFVFTRRTHFMFCFLILLRNTFTINSFIIFEERHSSLKSINSCFYSFISRWCFIDSAAGDEQVSDSAWKTE